MPIHPNTPILVGIGQTVSRWDVKGSATAPSPVSLCVTAARAALADTGEVEAVVGSIDVIAVVRTNLDSMPGTHLPTERCANPPATVASQLGLNVRRAVYSTVGGDQPQALVNEFTEVIFNGAAKAVLLTGAEAIAAMKAAARAGVRLDWSASTNADMEDRGLGKSLLTETEVKNGLGFPTQTYPVFEHALRARLGMDRTRAFLNLSESLGIPNAAMF